MLASRLISPVLLAALAACASAEGKVAPAAPPPEEAAAADTVPPAPVVEPDAPLEERWAAPFAVRSVGQLAAREPRAPAVRLEGADAARYASRADTAQLAPVAVDTASADLPAPARPAADTARAAPRTQRSGNGSATSAGASSSAPRTAATPASRGRRTHEVQPGETFYGVARKYQVSPADLRAANPGVDPEKLRSGTTLWIPAASASATSTPSTPPAAARTAEAPKPPARPAARTHKVVRGDTLFGIARKYGVTPAAIRAANRMEDDNVKLDQTLVIPGT